MPVLTDSTNHKSSSAEQLAHLSDQVHSNSENESHEALSELAKQGSNDAARALIESYQNCHWRDTRINIIRALGRNGSSRAIEFLLRLANDNFPGKQNEGKDNGICQETLLALGETRDCVASTFLLQRLDSSPVYLRAWIVNALSRIPDLRAAAGLHSLLESKESHEHPQLLRNTVVALSEMKDTGALQKFIEMLKQRTLNNSQAPDATALTLLSAIAQLSRNVSDIQNFERSFDSEMLHRHFYQQCLVQVTFRQQWTLEDYLGKIFFAEKIHHSLPLELNSFAETDVVEALSIFAAEEKHFSRLCLTIGSALNAENLLERFVRIENLGAVQAQTLLQHIVFLRSERANFILNTIAGNQLVPLWKSEDFSPLIAGWLRALICVHEKPLEALCEWMASENFRTSHERQRIEVINAFVNCCLVHKVENTWPKKQLQLLTDLINNETSTAVLGRWLRALGEIGLAGLKWSDALMNRITQNPLLHGSVLLMLENEESHQGTELLDSIAPTLKDNSEHTPQFLKACSTLRENVPSLPDDNTLKLALASTKFDETLAALTFLARHPRQNCLDQVLNLCASDSLPLHIKASSIVAARAYRHERSIRPLESCLLSTSRVLSGRALDALLHLELPSANDIVIKFFIGHLNNPSVCDKVLRSLKITAIAQPELAESLEKASQHAENSSLKDDILDLAHRLRIGQRGQAPLLPAAEAIRDIDKQLEGKITDYARLADPVKASLRSAELPLSQPELFEGTVDKSSSVVQYCKAIDLTLETDFGQRILFPKMEQQLHIFQNILHQAELDNESPNVKLLLRHFRADHVFDLHTFPATKMSMVARSILNGRILRERTQIIDGLKAWAVLLLMFSGHERLWGATVAKKDPLLFPTLAHKLVVLQDLRNPAAHRQTMMALAPLSEIRKEVFNVFALIKKAFE